MRVTEVKLSLIQYKLDAVVFQASFHIYDSTMEAVLQPFKDNSETICQDLGCSLLCLFVRLDTLVHICIPGFHGA